MFLMFLMICLTLLVMIKNDGGDKKVYGYIRLNFNSDVDLPLDN